LTAGKRSRNVCAVSLLLCVLFVFSGCAGNGAGLDEDGNPVGTDGNGLPTAFPPTFTNIQNNVFSAICIECHSGGSAPQGLQLDASVSYDNLINIRSVEHPELFRVSPGDPDHSYLVRKLEGGPDIAGAQMPLNRPPLSRETINSIRLWIAMGAPRN